MKDSKTFFVLAINGGLTSLLVRLARRARLNETLSVCQRAYHTMETKFVRLMSNSCALVRANHFSKDHDRLRLPSCTPIQHEQQVLHTKSESRRFFVKRDFYGSPFRINAGQQVDSRPELVRQLLTLLSLVQSASLFSQLHILHLVLKF